MDHYSHLAPHLSKVESIMERELGKEDERVYGMLVPFLKRGGKRIRPALCLLGCGASGGDYGDALEPAAIIELFHNFTLIHDDIEDGSQFRRGEPTLHVQFGIPMALNTGDALYTLLWKRLVGLPLGASKLVRLQKLYSESFKRVVEGQGVELHWIRSGRFDVSESDYLGMIGGKTSALMGLSCEAGAFIAGAGKRRQAALRRYGELVGAAFQIQDDVLNLTGDFGKYMKEIGGDITEGKRTLMVVHCLSLAPEPERARLTSILSSHTAEAGSVREAIEILGRSGSIDYARERAKSLIAAAKKELGKLPESRDRASLESIADYVISREK
ncbi:MAG: polyprenyl synthetase family protein [Candidatus Micrarchaeota archaeon]